MSTSDTHPWQERINRRLSEIADLPDGWLDGQGIRISADVIKTARQVLCMLAVASLAFPEIITPGGIVPTVDGGIDLEWRLRGGAWLSIEITADGRIEAMSATSSDKETALFGFLNDDIASVKP